MRRAVDEIERPSEWLRSLREDAAGFRELLDESKAPVVAAYRLASARSRAAARPSDIPTLREVHAALCDIFAATEAETPRPSRTSIVEECDHARLLVIGA